MTQPTKAQITYQVDGVESVLRFHSVIVEEHEISTEITSYPTQRGYVVANTAIKKNPKISIIGAVTNSPLIGVNEFRQYGLDNSKTVFAALKALIDGAVPCVVDTNLGQYTQVVFNNLKSKQEKGETNAATFVLKGQDIQVSEDDSSNAPTLIVFNEISTAKRATRVAELSTIGIDVPTDAILSEGSVDLNGSFSIETFNEAGTAMTTVYEHVGYDTLDKVSQYMIHTSDVEIAPFAVKDTFDWRTTIGGAIASTITELPADESALGAAQLAQELIAGSVGTVERIASGYLNTAIGDLEESVYGGRYGLTKLNTNAHLGQIISALGIDDFVVDGLGGLSEVADDLTDNLSGATEAIATAVGLGQEINGTPAKAMATVIKITRADNARDFFGDLI